MSYRGKSNQYRRKAEDAFNTKVVHEDYNEGYSQARAQIPHYETSGRRGRGNPVRRGYQERRVEGYRHKQSKITEGDLAEELKKKLFPGVKDGQSASERLEAVNTMKAITMCVTTRGIGFSTLHVFLSIYQFNNIPIRGSIFQLYRVALAVLECKVQIVQRGVACILDNEDDYHEFNTNEDFVVSAKGVVVLPDQLTSIVNSVGRIKISEKLYIPKIGRDNTDRRGIFIPQSEQVTFSNLRRVVQSLADERVNVDYRRRFYRNNPIPGTIWQGIPNDPILLNPDEIMPAEYGIGDLDDDISDVRAKLNHLNKKAPKYFTKPVSYEVDGTKSMLTCN